MYADQDYLWLLEISPMCVKLSQTDLYSMLGSDGSNQCIDFLTERLVCSSLFMCLYYLISAGFCVVLAVSQGTFFNQLRLNSRSADVYWSCVVVVICHYFYRAVSELRNDGHILEISRLKQGYHLEYLVNVFLVWTKACRRYQKGQQHKSPHTSPCPC